jgi:hypothetical protein
MRVIAALALILTTLSATAIDRIDIHVAQLAVAETTAKNLSATLTINSVTSSRLEIHAAQLALSAAAKAQAGDISGLHLRCLNPTIREPRFACASLKIDAISEKFSKFTVQVQPEYRSDTGAFSVAEGNLRLGGTQIRFAAHSTQSGWKANIRLPEIPVSELQPMLAGWITLPPDLALAGRTTIQVDLEESKSKSAARAQIDLREFTFQNTAATWISEKVEAKLLANLDLSASPIGFEVELAGQKGQFLGGPVLLDFDQNSLNLRASGTYTPQQIQLTSFESTQSQLAKLRGNAVIDLATQEIRQAHVEAEQLQFPATYSSFLQLPLATTPFNQLVTTGSISGDLDIVNNQPVAVNLLIVDLGFKDDSRALRVEGVNSALHWAASQSGPPKPSYLSWDYSQGWGIIGAKTRLNFVTNDRSFRLLDRARLPFFDGALIINTLAGENIGTSAMAGVFDAQIEPISMQPIAKALGLPEFSGQLSGRIPGLTYKDQLLSFQGNVEANMFDGRVVASNLRVRDLFGAWPRLYAEVVARNLDLNLITQTFEFGSITGRLDVDLTGLETFNWSPVAFDLKLVTAKGDRSKHRISQKAVQNLSNIGGGGGGVTAALQSGALQFFDSFGYDRLGLSCRLRNDVCQMDGVGKVNGGYYIVKGSSLPRINIIGNANRVDWPRLVSQLKTALSNTDTIVVN